jgi:lipoprotein-anchoring transpeptidase ErfK/SrfK
VDIARWGLEAKALEEKDDLVGARAKWRDVLQQTADARLRTEAEERIGKINIALILTPRLMPEKVEYVVQAGDAIKRIANKFGTTIDLVQESNQLQTPDLIKEGDRLLVVTGKFSIVVCKTRNDLVLRLNDEFFKRYRVGTGKYSTTPAGTFAIDVKQKEPPWSRPDGKQIPYGDKENILGTRWMSIRATGSTADIKGRGIHGTWDDTSLGKSESAGCIRMKNSDVEELYKLVPIKTPVTITE